MGSIKGVIAAFLLLYLFSFVFSPVFAQRTAPVALTAEISRLSGGASAADGFDKLLSLARLHRLSGDNEAALKAFDAALALSPGDARALLEQARLLISMAEYDKAASLLASFNGSLHDRRTLVEAAFLAAQLEAFRLNDLKPLAAMAGNDDFFGYRSAIYYTLWKLSSESAWKNRLLAEFPKTPEAKIARGEVPSAATPLWLLFPGRESIVTAITQPSAVTPVPATSAVTATPAPTQSTPAPVPAVKAQILQTGLFGRHENAQAMAERLKRAGFEANIFSRQVNGADYWAVGVSAGTDMNATSKKLKDAGFESFPVN